MCSLGLSAQSCLSTCGVWESPAPHGLQVSRPPWSPSTSAARRWPPLPLPFGFAVSQCPCAPGPGLGCSFLDPKIYPKADTRWSYSLPAFFFFFNVYLAAPGPNCGVWDTQSPLRGGVLPAVCGLLDVHVGSSFPSRDADWAPCSGSSESHEHQGSPSSSALLPSRALIASRSVKTHPPGRHT